MNRKKVGLALGGGGALALAHIGVIKVLKEHNIPIDYLSGTSMGSVIASLYALYQDIEYIEKETLKIRKRDLIKMVDLNNPTTSIIKGKRVKAFLRNYLGQKRFRHAKIPVAIGATSLYDGKKVTFTKGKLLNAVMYSMSFPVVFPALKYKRRYLVDGGLSDPTPIQSVLDMGADIVIGVDIYGLRSQKLKRNNIKLVMERSIQIILSKLIEFKEKEYEKNVIVLKPKTRNHFEMFNFLQLKKFINAGEREARLHINKIKRMIE